ncbi:secretin N-terminal domain-containing protein, partial [Salmonella enterica subsp. enterica serovar Typhimurium]|nr:secretin N-terminal domain-containing protein [Salmonella enterica subsp. enterica serovar Typhimurium]
GTGGGVTQRLTDVPSPVINSGEMKPLAMFGAQANNNAAPATVATRKITDIRYSGSLGRFLDLVTGRLGISWKYENGEVIFYYLETKRFDIQPADASYKLTGTVTSGLSSATGTDSSNSGGGSDSGVSGSGGSTMSSTVGMGNDLYKDLKTTVESMLTPGVGRLSLNSTTG